MFVRLYICKFVCIMGFDVFSTLRTKSVLFQSITEIWVCMYYGFLFAGSYVIVCECLIVYVCLYVCWCIRYRDQCLVLICKLTFGTIAFVPQFLFNF